MLNARIQGVSQAAETRFAPFYGGYEKGGKLELLDPDFGELFAGDELAYDDKWITYIVSELQGIMLTHPETNTDALGDAYEVLFVGMLSRYEDFTEPKIALLHCICF